MRAATPQPPTLASVVTVPAGSGLNRSFMTPPPNARTSGTQFQGLVPIPTDPAIDPPSHACIQCWKFGHSRRVCREAVGRYCYYFGRRGVDLRTCPRCGPMHRPRELREPERCHQRDYGDGANRPELFPHLQGERGGAGPGFAGGSNLVAEEGVRQGTEPNFLAPEVTPQRCRTRRGRRSRQRGHERSVSAGSGRDRSPAADRAPTTTGPTAAATPTPETPRLDLERAMANQRLAQSLQDSPPDLRARVDRAATTLVEIRAIQGLIDSLIRIETAERDAILTSTLAG